MGSDYIPPWPPRYGWRGVSSGVPPSEMRVSDAERSEIAEQLSKHYADGRLDQAEFDERMGRAIAAKTRGDLIGLLSDLPPIAMAPVPTIRRHRSRAGLLLALVVVLLAMSSWGWNSWGPNDWLWRPHFGLLFVAIVGFVLARRLMGGFHLHHHHDDRAYRAR